MMRKILRDFFLVNLLLLVSINLAWSVGIKQKIISQETALEKIDELPEIKFLKKYYEGEDYYWSSFIQKLPDEVSSDFNIHCVIWKGEKKVFSESFYVNAYTGEVHFDEAVRKNILAMMEAEKIRQNTEAESREKEKSLKEELDRTYSDINQKRLLDRNEYYNLIQESIPLFLKAINAVTPEIRSYGARILGELARESFGGYKVKEAIPGLTELLKDKEYGTRYQAVVALGEIGDKGDKDLTGAILFLLKDSDSLVRRGAISALSKLGDSSLTPTFVSLLGDSSVNQEVVKALIQVGDERALEPLNSLFNNKDYFYLEKDIVYALAKVGGARSIPALIGMLDREYTHDTKYNGDFEPSTPYIGADAAQVLAKIGKDSVPYLLQTLQAKDYLTRLYSVYGLNLIKDQSSLNSLKDALAKEDSPTVKIYIEKAITEIEGRTFTAPVANLGVRIESSKQKYKLKEEINLFLCIENKESAPVIINTAPIFTGIFRVTDPDGKPVYCLTKWDRTDFPTRDSLITLNPGQTHKAGPFSIQEDYSFTAPGRYQIIGIYENRFNAIEFGVYAWVGRVESQAITIEVE